MQRNGGYRNNKKEEDTDVKEKDDKSYQELVKKNGWYRNNKRKETDHVNQGLMKRNAWYSINMREGDNNVEERTYNVKKNDWFRQNKREDTGENDTNQELDKRTGQLTKIIRGKNCR